MKITVAVKPNSRKESVEPQADGSLLVRVNAPPTEGKANERVIALLAEHFSTAKSRVSLVAGGKSKKKTFLIS